MTRSPLPIFRGDIQIVIDLSALDEGQAADRLEAIARDIEMRLGKSTFHRLAGKPVVVMTAPAGDPVSQ